MNSTHVEYDALAALRGELVKAAGRRSAKRRATRRKVIVVAVAALLLAATAATAALTHFSTGVGAVDSLLEIDVPESRHPAPGPGSASEALPVRIGDGTYQTVAYLARDGSVCIASAERHRGSVRGSFGGCPPLEDVNRRVQHRGAVWYGSSHGPDQRTYQLLVGGNVKSVRPLGEGDWNVLSTPSWTPYAPGARPLKLVVVIDEMDIDMERAGMHFPKLELTYANGSSRIARAP